MPFHQEFGRAEVGDAASVTLRIAVVLPSGGPMMRPGAPDLVTLAVVDGEAVTDLATLDGEWTAVLDRFDEAIAARVAASLRSMISSASDSMSSRPCWSHSSRRRWR